MVCVSVAKVSCRRDILGPRVVYLERGCSAFCARTSGSFFLGSRLRAFSATQSTPQANIPGRYTLPWISSRAAAVDATFTPMWMGVSAIPGNLWGCPTSCEEYFRPGPLRSARAWCSTRLRLFSGSTFSFTLLLFFFFVTCFRFSIFSFVPHSAIFCGSFLFSCFLSWFCRQFLLLFSCPLCSCLAVRASSPRLC